MYHFSQEFQQIFRVPVVNSKKTFVLIDNAWRTLNLGDQFCGVDIRCRILSYTGFRRFRRIRKSDC